MSNAIIDWPLLDFSPQSLGIKATEEEIAFIRAILAAPNDDAPRLIFADWLDEHDKDTTYIRGQIHRPIENQRAYSFIRVHQAKGGFFDWLKGFLETISCEAEWWLAHGRSLMRFHPIRQVDFIRPPIWRTQDDYGLWSMHPYNSIGEFVDISNPAQMEDACYMFGSIFPTIRFSWPL
jgi:uncharacterized protein (TIGR02996 family)